MSTAQRAAGLLASQQRRVRDVTGSIPDPAWDAVQLAPEQVAELVGLGHFTSYASELTWTPRFVVGHLGDSATIFADRIAAILSEDKPVLHDFVPDEPARLNGYAAAGRGDLEARLENAQRRLLEVVSAVPEDSLGRAGMHAVDGEVTVQDLLGFLPTHQRDHAVQVETLSQA